MRRIEEKQSPWMTELSAELASILDAVKLHEDYPNHENSTTHRVPPRETALGHRPKGTTVAGHAVQTDAALAALECSD